MLCKLLTIVLIGSIDFVCCVELKYHNNRELEQYLKNFTQNDNGPKTRVYSIGKSMSGENLWVLEMTAVQEDLIAAPNIKFVGTIHGNEPVGREILLYFMEHLRDNYKSNSTIKWLLENTKIHFLPNLNPDGFSKARQMCAGEDGRENRGRFDLNRNFPSVFHQNRIPRQSETKAVERWMTETPFILSAALHGGALVANYPYDSVKEKSSFAKQPPSLTPDDDVFKHLASTYANYHATMHKGKSCNGDHVEFKGGITNGAAWYTLSGGMQDYNYAKQGCMEITLEISCCKFPPPSKLPIYWQENKEALVAFSLQAHKGVSGQIMDSVTFQPVQNASLRISERDMTFYSKHRGEFWRLLLPGNYELEISAVGYFYKKVSFTIEDYNTKPLGLKFLKIFLTNSSFSTTLQTSTEFKTEYFNTTLDSGTASVISSTDKEFLNELVFDKQTLEQINGSCRLCVSLLLFLSVILYLLFVVS